MDPLALMTVLSVLTATTDVRAVATDGDVLWLGTSGGLARLEDGSTELLTPEDGLPDGTVRALHVSSGSIWVGTDRGAARLSRAGDRVEAVVRLDAPVRAFAEWRGALWIGTWRGLYRLDAATGEPVLGAEVERITALGATADLLYVATAGNRLHAYDGRSLTQLRTDRLAWDVAVDGEQVWVATSRGLTLFVHGRARPSQASAQSRSLPIADLRAVRVVRGRLVVGSHGAGLFAWSGEAWEPLSDQPSWLRTGRVQALGATSDGRLLVATPAGLAIGSDEGWSRTGAAGLPDNDLSCLARTDEGLWVGTFRSGLALLRPSGAIEAWNEERGLVDDRVNRLAVDAEGDLWVATDRGVMERRSGRFFLRGLLGEHVFVVAAVGRTVYASSGAELLAWDGAEFRAVDAHPGRRPQDLGRASDGTTLSATAEGLARGTGDAWTLVTSGPGSIADDWVTAVAEWRGSTVAGFYAAGLASIDESGVHPLRSDLWVNAGALCPLSSLLAVGTLDQGLWLFDGSRWRGLTAEDGLPDDDVTDVEPDGLGGLWVATRGGLAHVGARRP